MLQNLTGCFTHAMAVPRTTLCACKMDWLHQTSLKLSQPVYYSTRWR